jgi:hypothetical protein
MARVAVVGPDSRVLNLVEAPAGWQPPADQTTVPADATVAIGDTWNPATQKFTRTPTPIEARRAAKLARIMTERAALLAAGAPCDGHRIEVDDPSRANLGGMATTAALALLGVVPWPNAYAQGWITLDNGRIPLPEPRSAIALAATAGEWYGGVVQRGRDLKDAVLAAADPDTVTISWAPFDAAP